MHKFLLIIAVAALATIPVSTGAVAGGMHINTGYHCDIPGSTLVGHTCYLDITDPQVIAQTDPNHRIEMDPRCKGKPDGWTYQTQIVYNGRPALETHTCHMK